MSRALDGNGSHFQAAPYGLAFAIFATAQMKSNFKTATIIISRVIRSALFAGFAASGLSVAHASVPTCEELFSADAKVAVGAGTPLVDVSWAPAAESHGPTSFAA